MLYKQEIYPQPGSQTYQSKSRYLCNHTPILTYVQILRFTLLVLFSSILAAAGPVPDTISMTANGNYYPSSASGPANNSFTLEIAEGRRAC